MEIFQAIILGLVQGLTELLPISSSAHLALIPWAFDWIKSPEFKLAFESFDIALHAGTLLAIGLFFLKDWILLIGSGFKQVIKKEKTKEGTMFWYIVLATLPGGIIGLLLDKLKDYLKMPLIIAISLIIMGILLYIIDKKSASKVKYENLTLKETFLIGLSQCLAFIPGVSRSGITMTTGRLLGIERESVAKLSFMLATPIVAAATLYKLKDFVFSAPFIIGVAVSFVVGLIVIKFLLEYLKKGSFKVFAIYRVILGLITIGLLIIK